METIEHAIMEAIYDDLCGRCSFDLGTLDEETKREIRNTWQAMIKNMLKEAKLI